MCSDVCGKTLGQLVGSGNQAGDGDGDGLVKTLEKMLGYWLHHQNVK